MFPLWSSSKATRPIDTVTKPCKKGRCGVTVNTSYIVIHLRNYIMYTSVVDMCVYAHAFELLLTFSRQWLLDNLLIEQWLLDNLLIEAKE